MQMSAQNQKVMLVGCDWRISIRLVCLARRKMSGCKCHEHSDFMVCTSSKNSSTSKPK